MKYLRRSLALAFFAGLWGTWMPAKTTAH